MAVMNRTCAVNGTFPRNGLRGTLAYLLVIR
jgi:hypothetical protein